MKEIYKDAAPTNTTATPVTRDAAATQATGATATGNHDASANQAGGATAKEEQQRTQDAQGNPTSKEQAHPTAQQNPDFMTDTGRTDQENGPGGKGGPTTLGGMGAAFGGHFSTSSTSAAATDTKIGNSGVLRNQSARPGENIEGKPLEFMGDVIAAGPLPVDTAKPTLRPQYPNPNGSEVVPSTRKQLESDLAFDLFSVVRPGHGLGSDNKLFVQDQIWEDKIRGMAPHMYPRGNAGGLGGPEGGIRPAPWKLSNVMHKSQVDGEFAKVGSQIRSAAMLAQATGSRTLRALPDEPMARHTATGLKRKASPFEPMYHNHDPWLPYNEQAGIFLNKRGFKHQYNPMRRPLHVEHDPENGMQTLNKRRALEVILQ